MLPRRDRPEGRRGPEGVRYPPPFEVNGRLYNWRSHIEWYKQALVCFALGQDAPPMPPARPVGDAMVPLRVAASELGVTRRTIGRRIRIEAAAAVSNPVAAE